MEPKQGEQQSSLLATCERFALYTSSLGNYFFGEIRDLLASGLEGLGFEVNIRNERDGFGEEADWHVVIAPHEFFYLGAGRKLRQKEFPESLILVNTEQPSTQWFSLAYKCFSKAHSIWDINYESSRLILNKGFGCENLPLGYVPGFKLFQEVKELPDHYGTCFLEPEIRNRAYLHKSLVRRPIDVLFVGTLTGRRKEFFAKAAPVLSNYLCYLHVPDASGPRIPGANTYMDTATVIGLGQRSKIVLNIHQGEDKYFEWHRIVMHGIWQKAFVISEPSSAAPPFQPGVDFVEASLEEIPEKINYYLSSPEGQKEAQKIATRGFQTLTKKCRLADLLRPLILQLYAPRPQRRFGQSWIRWFWQSSLSLNPPAADRQEQIAGKFQRFSFKCPIFPQRTPEEIKQLKIHLIASIGKADSISDYGGLWGVHGLYLLEGAKALNSKYAQMIDVTPREEFWPRVHEVQTEMNIQVEMKHADFRDPDLFKSLVAVDVSLLYEVMLHQDNPEEVIKNVLSKTLRCVCLAQPVLKEEMFTLPNGCVNLQFYPQQLKDMLRVPGWWPKEPVVSRFETQYWMWGQTVSYFKSIFYGYGWDMEHLEVYHMSSYWNYALMRLVPRESSRGQTSQLSSNSL